MRRFASTKSHSYIDRQNAILYQVRSATTVGGSFTWGPFSSFTQNGEWIWNTSGDFYTCFCPQLALSSVFVGMSSMYAWVKPGVCSLELRPEVGRIVTLENANDTLGPNSAGYAFGQKYAYTWRMPLQYCPAIGGDNTFMTQTFGPTSMYNGYAPFIDYPLARQRDLTKASVPRTIKFKFHPVVYPMVFAAAASLGTNVPTMNEWPTGMYQKRQRCGVLTISQAGDFSYPPLIVCNENVGTSLMGRYLGYQTFHFTMIGPT